MATNDVRDLNRGADVPDAYRYNLREHSLTQRWLTDHVWVPMAHRLPPSFRPNAITLCGALFMLASLVFVRAALGGDRLGYLGAGLCTLLYFIADNVDGPFARRTGQTSHLGEFLDHWLDTLNGAVLTMGTALCLGARGPVLLVLAGGVALSYFATIWEQRRTGVFHSERLGSNEAILVGLGVYGLLFAFGPAPWLTYAPAITNPVLGLALFAITVSVLTVISVLRRTRTHLEDFVPLALTVFGLSLLSVAGLVSEVVAAAGMLAANALLSGSLLLDRLAGLRSRARGLMVSCASILAVVLALVRPEGLSSVFGHHAFLAAVTLLLVLLMCWDLIRATRALRARTSSR